MGGGIHLAKGITCQVIRVDAPPPKSTSHDHCVEMLLGTLCRGIITSRLDALHGVAICNFNDKACLLIDNTCCLVPSMGSYICEMPLLPCYGHTTTKAPDPIRTRKLNVVGLD